MIDETKRQELSKLANGVMKPVLTVASRRLVQSMEHIFAEEVAPLVDEIDRLKAALLRIDGINDNPARYNSEINDVIDAALGRTHDQPTARS